MNSSYIVVGTLFALVALKVLFSRVLNTSTPFLVVMSRSMKPTLKIGDLLIISNRNIDIPQVGQIIIFQEKNTEKLVAHRVIRIFKTDQDIFLVTKGDANENPDPGCIELDMVKGIKLSKIPLVAYPVYFINYVLGKTS